MNAILLAITLFAQTSASDVNNLLSPPLRTSEIPDLSSLPLLNPDFTERKTAKLRLDNGLEILLISDPNTDNSAAAVAVETGSWNDPPEFPGMAHFCEHMLFMGTEKYPDESEFMALVADHGGMANATTTADKTVYMFSSNEEGYPALLDRFAHFFIDPLFKPFHISQEMHAVDQEFAKSVENDGWRSMMVFKETGNPEHPNRMFNCGNSKTLSNIPQTALQKWHKMHYSAKKMHAVLYSSLKLEVLKEMALLAFGKVANSASATTIDPTIPLTSVEQRGHIVYIKPIQDKQNLHLLWELPISLSEDPTHSADLIAYALKRGQKHNLYETLKEDQLINSLSIDIEELGGRQHRFFEISLDLTEKGMKMTDQVLLKVFQSITLIQSTGVPHYLFQERNRLAQLNYQYQSRQDAFSYVMQLAMTLPDEALETYPRNQLLASEYSPQKITETLSFLTSDRCVILFLGSPQLTQVTPEKSEQWFGAEYAIRPLPSMIAEKSASLESPIRLPEPNSFVPSHLNVVSEPSLGDLPFLISENEFGMAYFARCPEFKNPEAAIKLHLLSPELNAEPRAQVLAALYCAHLTDRLHPTFDAASEANLHAALYTDRSRIHIAINGFSEKAPLLLQEILRQLTLEPPTRDQFDLLKAAMQKELANAQKELAFRQAKDLADSLLNQDKTTKLERLAALEAIEYDDFLIFHKKLLDQTYTEAFFSGNLTLKEAESAWLDVIHVLGKAAFSKQEHPKVKIASLPEKPYSIVQTTKAQGNAAFLFIDAGSFTHPKRASQDILSAALKEAFFNELRTKQKTGYIALADGQELEERLFELFVVQSNSHQPEELLYRFEFFLEDFLNDLENKISKERFAILRESAAGILKNRFCNLKEKSALLDLLAFQYRGDFRFLEKRIDAIKHLSYEEFCKTTKQFLSRQNKKRLAILFEGKIPAPFSYEATTPSQLAGNATYEPKPEKIAENTSSASTRRSDR